MSTDIDLLIDLHRDGDRQGPGGDEETRLAITLSGLATGKRLSIADIGCGTGASTRLLASVLDATITAVDFLPTFLEALESTARHMRFDDRIQTLEASMDALPFEADSLDAIWSEGAIYNIGFADGVRNWRRFLKSGGVLAVSELTWLTRERPAELDEHWRQEYPEVDTASAKIRILEDAGYSPLGWFALPPHCWLDNYYRPMQARFPAFLSRHGESDAVKAIVAAEAREIELYERYSDFVSYGFYVAKRV